MLFSSNLTLHFSTNLYPGTLCKIRVIFLKVNVIDLFAGPGGLGEGFFSFIDGEQYPFTGICSVEMDTHAHKTLT